MQGHRDGNANDEDSMRDYVKRGLLNLLILAFRGTMGVSAIDSLYTNKSAATYCQTILGSTTFEREKTIRTQPMLIMLPRVYAVRI